jgi:hypothetical protein
LGGLRRIGGAFTGWFLAGDARGQQENGFVGPQLEIAEAAK